MKIHKVLLSTKKTALEHFKEQSDTYERELPAVEVEELRKNHAEHYASLNKIRDVLAKYNIQFDRTYMPYSEYEDFKGKDLIISVGGDGTVLNTSHYTLDETPVLIVKSTKGSTGELCEIDADNFENALEKILTGNFKIEKWTRAEGCFGKRKIFALNEIYVGTRFNPSMARYELAHKDKSELQMSSGVVVTTGTGSTGWYANIPVIGKAFPKDAKELRFCVREPKVAATYAMLHGVLLPGEILRIRSKMNIDGCISFDGDVGKRLYPFRIGDVLEVQISDKPLYVIKL
jgi:NAD kinase